LFYSEARIFQGKSGNGTKDTEGSGNSGDTGAPGILTKTLRILKYNFKSYLEGHLV